MNRLPYVVLTLACLYSRGVPAQAASAPSDSAGFWLWSIGLIVLGLVLIALLPRFARGVAQGVAKAAHLKFGRSLLIAVGALVFVPIAAAAPAVTIVGIPIGIVLLLGYLSLLVAGYTFARLAS